jgi:3-hydroxybutyryl-CoA dehydratase|tara:strand:- start:305 stop:736 length:432 start_codon:yes stop_codon:yes gene_type:complete
LTNSPLKYTFDSINIGINHEFKITITEKIVSDFSVISGDFNPLHMDENYAAKTKFKKRICHGMLLASFFSRLVGMYLPGESALYFSQSLNFISPCFINDKIVVKGEIIDKNHSTKIITVKTSIINQKNELILDGEAKVMMINS